MSTIQVHEVYSVTVQVDSQHPDTRRIRPDTIVFDTMAEASQAIERALQLPLPSGWVTVMVSRERQDEPIADDPEFNDWPSQRHIVSGPYTAEDYE